MILNPPVELVLILTILVVFNAAMSLLIWHRDRNPFTKGLFLFWFWSIGLAIANLLASQISLSASLITLGLAGTVGYFFQAKLLADLVAIPMKIGRFLVVSTAALSISFLAWMVLGIPLELASLPSGIAAALPLYDCSIRTIFHRRPPPTFFIWGLAIAMLLFALMIPGYFLISQHPRLFYLGFLLSFLFLFCISFFAPMAVLEKATREKAALQAEVRYKEALLHSSRLLAIGEMAGGIAHEVNNPLAILTLQVEQLQTQHPALNPDSLRKIETSIQRITAVIRGLMFFCGHNAYADEEQTPAQDLLRQTLDLCREACSKDGVSVESIFTSEESRAQGVNRQVAQVLMALILNAKTAVEAVPHKRIRITVGLLEKHIEFAVSDSGGGIPLENRLRLFQPFFTTKPVGQGMGLGLSTAKGTVESLGGVIFFDETSSETRFVVRIPRWQTR